MDNRIKNDNITKTIMLINSAATSKTNYIKDNNNIEILFNLRRKLVKKLMLMCFHILLYLVQLNHYKVGCTDRNISYLLSSCATKILKET